MLPVTKYEVQNRLTDIYERRQNMYTNSSIRWIILTLVDKT